MNFNTLVDLLRHRALHQPSRAAYTFLQNGNLEAGNLTFEQLDRRARAIAAYLQSLKAGGERALLLYPQGLEFIAAFFGCLYAGVIAIPAPPPDSTRLKRSLPRLQAIALDAGATLVLTTESIQTQLVENTSHIICEFPNVHWLCTKEVADSKAQEWLQPEINRDTIAYLQYTSGSTSTPKGVMLSHGNLIHHAAYLQNALEYALNSVTVTWMPYFHDYGLVQGTIVPLYTNTPCYLMSPFAFIKRPFDWLEAISRYRGTHSQGPNFAYDQCLRRITPQQRTQLDLSSWQSAGIGAEPISPKVMQDFIQTFAPYGFRAEAFAPGYGLAEATLGVSTSRMGELPVFCTFDAASLQKNQVVEATKHHIQRRTIPGCGSLVGDTKVVIVNPEKLTQCAPDEVGEIWVSDPSVALGYWQRFEETEKTFRAQLQDAGEETFLRTGDLGFILDGELFVTGRIKDLIIILGRNYYPQDIELTVERSHKALRFNGGAAFSVEVNGEERLVVVQEIERDQLENLDVSEVVEAIHQAVAEEHELKVYAVVLIKSGSLPKTSSGKIQRHACRNAFLSGTLNVVGWTQNSSNQAEFLHPRTPTEEKIAQIWAECLGLLRVGINDNFFTLGGNSLLATQIISRLREAYSLEIALGTLFESPTVAQLARTITQLRTSNDKNSSTITLPTIVPTPEKKYQPFPLTDIQQAYWLGRNQNFDLGNISTHVYIELDCDDLNLPQLNQAWQKLVEHHDMLRAVVLASGEQQILEKVPPYSIEVLDLRCQLPSDISEQLEAIRLQMSHEVLPAEQWPLFKIRATRLDEKLTRLHLSFDAIIADAWSMILLGQQWQQLYENPSTYLPPLEISFRDYVLTELLLKDTPQYQKTQEYWFNRNLPPAPELPFALHPSSVTKPEFKCHSARLEVQEWQQLKQRATKANLTHSAVLLAAFADVLNYWSKSPNFTINLTLFNRFNFHPQVNQLVGDFTSLTLLEVDHSIAYSFTVHAQKLQQQLWQDLDHSYVSGVEVQRELRRRCSTQPMGVVFTSTLGLNSLIENTSSSNWLGEVVYSISQTPQVWLDHQISESDGALVFNWDVVEQLFPPGLIKDMFASYCNWLEQLANTDSAWSETHPQLLPPQQLSSIVAVNDTDTAIDQETLQGLFYKQVVVRSQQAAVIAPYQTLTYEQLHQLANSLGRRLRLRGATPNTLVAVIMEKGWEQIVAVLGILMSGAAYLPISPEFPQERQRYLLEQGGVKLVVTQPQLQQNLSLPSGIECLSVSSSELQAADLNLIETVQTPDDLAYVIYTSGSTGNPKGVMIDHKGAVNTILDINKRFGVGVNDRVLALSALDFDLSVYDIFGILAAGGAIVIPEPQECRIKYPAHGLALLNAHQVTIWNTVPALMQILVEHLSGKANKQVGGLRLVLLSGDWLPVDLPEKVKSLYSKIQVVSLGGATEASIWSIFYPIDQVESSWKSIPYGKPLNNQRFYVLNQLMQTTPTWVSGELYIGGIGLAKGYWQDEEKTNNSFITHPVTGERLYKTGDLGRYLSDGNIEFLGREDFQVKINGFRIELGEVEAALKQHPALKEAVVTSHNNQQGKRI
ncbi:MAG: amino acid adenylation domain-containing protein [Rhizonema sp. PD38]|nr:amino acid adenylation domain-containing protein [Rhizonema sp. PD38]